MSVLENAKERPRAWSSVVFMAPWSTLGRLLTQAPLLTRPNLSKEAPWVGQRRPNRTPPLQALSDHVGPRKRQGKAARLVERCFHGPMEHPRPPVNSGTSFDPTKPL